MEIKINQWGSGWQNLIHFNHDDNRLRIPAIFTREKNSQVPNPIHVCHSSGGNTGAGNCWNVGPGVMGADKGDSRWDLPLGEYFPVVFEQDYYPVCENNNTITDGEDARCADYVGRGYCAASVQVRINCRRACEACGEMLKWSVSVMGHVFNYGTSWAARPYLNVDIWAGDKWYPPTDGSVRNIEVMTPLPAPSTFTEEDCNYKNSGLFWDGAKCADCGVFCYECSDASTCTKCFRDIEIVGGKCQVTRGNAY